MLKRWWYFSLHSISGKHWTLLCKFELDCDPDTSKGNDLENSLDALLPAPWSRLYPPEQWCCILDCLWAPCSGLLHGITCALTYSGISETSWPGLLSEHAEAPFDLEEQAMGNIALLKDIHCSFSLIPVSPFKVKMTWQDKVMPWRAVWGLWGHLFCRPGINSLHMCCCSKICLYSMCRFRRNVQQAEEMHLSSAGRDSSPAELT